MKPANAAAARPEQNGGPTIELLDFSHQIQAHYTGVKVELKVNGATCVGSAKTIQGTVEAFDEAVRKAIPHTGVVVDSGVESSKDSKPVRVFVRYLIGTRKVVFKAEHEDEIKAYLLAILEAAAEATRGTIIK